MNVKEFYRIIGKGEPPEELVRESDAMEFYNTHKEVLRKEAYFGHLVAEDILNFYTIYRNRYDNKSITQLEKAIKLYKQIEQTKQYCEQMCFKGVGVSVR